MKSTATHYLTITVPVDLSRYDEHERRAFEREMADEAQAWFNAFDAYAPGDTDRGEDGCARQVRTALVDICDNCDGVGKVHREWACGCKVTP